MWKCGDVEIWGCLVLSVNNKYEIVASLRSLRENNCNGNLQHTTRAGLQDSSFTIALWEIVIVGEII